MLVIAFADAKFLADPDFDAALQIAAVAGVLLLLAFLVPIWLLLRFLRRSRELLNAERLKALELGQSPIFTVPDNSKEKLLEMLQQQEKDSVPQRYAHNAFWVAFWVGAVVPIAVAGFAASITSQAHMQSLVIVNAIWICTTVICVSSVVCATVVMGSVRRAVSEKAKPAPSSPPDDEKH